jgi:hypothetical protein
MCVKIVSLWPDGCDEKKEGNGSKKEEKKKLTLLTERAKLG